MIGAVLQKNGLGLSDQGSHITVCICCIISHESLVGIGSGLVGSGLMGNGFMGSDFLDSGLVGNGLFESGLLGDHRTCKIESGQATLVTTDKSHDLISKSGIKRPSTQLLRLSAEFVMIVPQKGLSLMAKNPSPRR